MATIYHTKAGTWRAVVSWRENGKLKQLSKTFDLKQQAEAWYNSNKNHNTNDISIGDYFHQWYLTFKFPYLSRNSQSHYIRAERKLREYFGETGITSISRFEYQSFINSLMIEYAPETLRKINSLVSGAIKSAYLDQLLDRDFTVGVRVIGNPNRVRRVDYLNLDELERLTRYLAQHLNPRFTNKYMLLFAIYTGMRIGEIMALEWTDIDFENQIVHITKSYDFKLKQIKPPKNESSYRSIIVPKDILNVLNELKTTNNRKLVFETKQGTMAHPNSVNATLKKALNNLHINRPGFHTHSLRHTHVALLLSQGVDLFAISKRLGHSDVGTTTKYYAYLVHEYAEMENQKIINAFNELDLSSDVDNYQHTKKPVKRAIHQINTD